VAKDKREKEVKIQKSKGKIVAVCYYEPDSKIRIAHCCVAQRVQLIRGAAKVSKAANTRCI
jgi:hypothetical protein